MKGTPSVRPDSPAEDGLAAELRGFGPIGLMAILAILFLGPTWFRGLLVLAWAWRSRTPWREIGYVRPKSWLGSLAVGVVFGCLFKLLMKAVVMPLLGADPINHAYHYLAGNRAALPAILFLLAANAGFGEETIFRGYMFERMRKLFGRGTGATIAIVMLTTVWFALVHYPDQGLAGAEQALFTGGIFGTIYAVTGRLWMLMVAHLAFDLTALAIIYWGDGSEGRASPVLRMPLLFAMRGEWPNEAR